jgi:D-glycero-beta-D-manno-heptose 1-phosphate adenylyltransferase
MKSLAALHQKIGSLQDVAKKVDEWKIKGEKVVLTNGCFDILHVGHVTYLTRAAELGTKLVVALNTDESVKRLGKGDDRPINSETARLQVMAALGAVDAVLLFNEDTPLQLIQQIQPDVLVKGADYDPNETDPASKKYIVGREAVISNGGKVIAIDLVPGFSTTAILEKVRK